MRGAGFRILAHTADVGLEAWGPDRATAFVQAAVGMFSLMADRRRVRPLQCRRIAVQAPDRQALLVAWLTELLYHVDTERLLFRDAAIESITDTGLEATARGEPADEQRHQLKAAVKAATYHQLNVEQQDGAGWRVRVYLDV